MDSQTVIKVILIVVFAAFAVFLMLPGRSVRHVAVRRLLMVVLLALTVFAVIYPGAINAVAHAVGVGRGTDLLLYGLIVIFVGNVLVQQRRSRHVERQITQLARRLAIAQAELPAPGTASSGAAQAEDGGLACTPTVASATADTAN
ncbi:MAG TPA: DUF2304 domain-containing protein [Gryllotalpicola sp.]